MHRVTMACWAVAALVVAGHGGWSLDMPVALPLGGFLGVWSLSRVQRWWGE